MKYIMLFSAVTLLAGCTAVPVKPKFPDVPAELLQACPKLNAVSETTKLSDILNVVVDNYALYHECKIKNDAWAEWYKTQRTIYEK